MTSKESILSPIAEEHEPGFSVPGNLHLNAPLDLNQRLVQHPAATFFLRFSGNSMEHEGIHNHDILIVDRSLEPSHNRIVVCDLNGQLTVRRMLCGKNQIEFRAGHPDYVTIRVDARADLDIWGVVTYAIHTL